MGWTLVEEVLEDPDLAQTVDYHELTGTVNRDGRSIPQFADPVPVTGLVRPKDAMSFAVTPEGQDDATELYLFVNDATGVENDDRIGFRGDYYRAAERQINFDGPFGPTDEFSLFALHEDSRDQDTDSSTDGSDDSGGDNFEEL